MDSANYFREKAARCRLLLALATNPEVKEQLRLWVWEFEDRADSAERRRQRRQRMRAGWRRISQKLVRPLHKGGDRPPTTRRMIRAPTGFSHHRPPPQAPAR